MDLQQDRRRSASINNNKNVGLSPPVSPHIQYRDPVPGQEIDPALVATTSFNNGSFPASDTGVPHDSNQFLYNPYQDLNSSASPQNLQLHSHTSPPADQHFAQSFEASFAGQLEQTANTKRMQGEEGLQHSDPNRVEDFPLYQNMNHNTNNPSVQDIDPSLMYDPQYQPGPAVNQSVNPADLSRMSSPNNPSPPNLAPPEPYSSPGQQQPSSPTSPGTYYTPQHSRHASLDPASAAFMTAGQGHSDWQGMLENPSFQGHRRTPSEHSDVSSVTHSPFMSHHDYDPADNNNPSPHLTAQNDPSLYENALAIEGFSISEPQPQAFSPAHSPYISPQLSPQQIGDFGPENNFLNQTQNIPFPQMAPDPYAMKNEEAPMDMGQAAQMAAPTINVEFAPPAKNSNFEVPKSQTDMDALIPPTQRSMFNYSPLSHYKILMTVNRSERTE